MLAHVWYFRDKQFKKVIELKFADSSVASSIGVFDYFFKIKAINYAVCVATHTLYTIRPL